MWSAFPATGAGVRPDCGWRRLLRALLVLLAGLAPGGCGERVQTRGEVTGRVTLRGQPLPGGLVQFRHADRGHVTTARIEPDGRYEVITPQGKGLPPRTYQVSLLPPPLPAFGPNPTFSRTEAPAAPRVPTAIPARYRDPETSDLSLTVREGVNVFDIELKAGGNR